MLEQLTPLKDEKTKVHNTYVPSDTELQQYRTPLLNYFRRRLPAGADVEDLVQEVFLRMVKRSTDSPIENVQYYIFRVAANTLNNYLRQNAVRNFKQHDEYDEDTSSLPSVSLERDVIAKQSVEQFKAALNTLPNRTKDIFILRVIQNRPYAEIAKLLDLSTRTIEKHVVIAINAIDGYVNH